MNLSFPVSFLSGAPGAGEMILIFVVILLLFGPKRLPEIARMIGRTLDELRKASQDFKDQIMAIDEEPPGSTSGEEDSHALDDGEYGEDDVDDGDNWDDAHPEDDDYYKEYGYEEPPDSGDGDGFGDGEETPIEEAADGEAVTGEGEAATGIEDVATDGESGESGQEEDSHDLAG